MSAKLSRTPGVLPPLCLVLPAALWLTACGPPRPVPASQPAAPGAQVKPQKPKIKVIKGRLPDRDPTRMVVVAAGPFLRGSLPGKGEPDESPQRQIQVSKFYIDRRSVTVKQYMRCLEAGVCSQPDLEKGCNWPSAKTMEHDDEEQQAPPPPPKGSRRGKPSGPTPEQLKQAAEVERLKQIASHPINCVSWFQAQEYCKWAGKRLPTETEWEKAARWVDGRVYPWGNNIPSCQRANYFKRKLKKYCHGGTVPVTEYKHTRSPYGAVQMSGNVYEWVQDWYAKDYYRTSPAQDPMGAYEGKYRVIRGGSWFSPPIDLRAAMRGPLPPVMQLAYVGFRCASDPKKFWKKSKAPAAPASQPAAAASDDKAADQPAKKASGKPAKKASGKPANKASGKAGGKPGGKPR